MRYKCNPCHLILNPTDLIDGKCPVCKENISQMCEKDHVCTCHTMVSEGIHYCSNCGKPICKCGSHDVATISRVTGYLQAVEGWNSAKKQELKDRQHYAVI